jgi:hypothetical protein
VAKRFTDSDKWRKPWFRALNAPAKMAWIYLTDNCDHAGIWPAAFDLMSGDVGIHVDEESLVRWFGDKIIKIDETKFFIAGYVEFQYGELKSDSKPHLSVIRILEKNGIDPKTLTLSKGYRSSIRTAKDKDKNKAKNQAKEYSAEFEKAWAMYPRKDDKGDAWRAYRDNVGETEHDEVLVAISKYRDKLKLEGTEARFVKHGATFFNKRRWRDCLEPTFGQSDDFSKGGDYDWADITNTKGAS